MSRFYLKCLFIVLLSFTFLSTSCQTAQKNASSGDRSPAFSGGRPHAQSPDQGKPLGSCPSSGPAPLSGNTFAVEDYGASGSSAITQCSATKGSTTLTCTGSGGFGNNYGIRIPGAGGAVSVPPITAAPIVKRLGKVTGGTHTYCYIAVTADGLNGVQTPSLPGCISNEPESLDVGAYNSVSATASKPAFATFLVYVSIDSGPYQLISSSFVETTVTLEDMGGTRFNQSFSGLVSGWPNPLPSTSPGVPIQNRDLFANTTAATQSQITLDKPALYSVSNVNVLHDDTDAIQRAIDAASAAGGGTVLFKAAYYFIAKPYFVIYAGNGYTPDPALSRPWVRADSLHLDTSNPDHIHFQGSGTFPTITHIHTGNGGSGVNGLISVTTGNLLSGPVGGGPNGNYAILPIEKNSVNLTLADAANAVKFAPGDDLWLYSGSFDPTYPGTPGFQACAVAHGGCHFSEINRVQSVDAATGQIALVYPTSKKYWNDGQDTFGVVLAEKGDVVHDFALKNMWIDTASSLLSPTWGIDFLYSNLRVDGPMGGNGLGTGYRRHVVFQNNIFIFGNDIPGWNSTQEFDQGVDFEFDHNQITGQSTPGSEQSYSGARYLISEGSGGFIFKNNTFTGVEVNFQDTTDDVIENNVFNNSNVTIGGIYNSILYGGHPDWDYLSFASYDSVIIANNTFNINSQWNQSAIGVGNLPNTQITGNIISYASPIGSPFGVIALESGVVSGNKITVNSAMAHPIINVYPDPVPGQPSPKISITGNTIVSNAPGAAVQIQAPSANYEADICVENNSLAIGKAQSLVVVKPAMVTMACH